MAEAIRGVYISPYPELETLAVVSGVTATWEKRPRGKEWRVTLAYQGRALRLKWFAYDPLPLSIPLGYLLNDGVLQDADAMAGCDGAERASLVALTQRNHEQARQLLGRDWLRFYHAAMAREHD